MSGSLEGMKDGRQYVQVRKELRTHLSDRPKSQAAQPFSASAPGQPHIAHNRCVRFAILTATVQTQSDFRSSPNSHNTSQDA
jgi:hypothetical protein